MKQLLEPRLRLFSFAAAQDRLLYLWILRAMERARERYAYQLGTSQIAEELETLQGDADSPLNATNLQASLDQLVEWDILSRTQDSSRVRSIAEYRLRRSTYQFTSMGWRAYQAVEDLLTAKETDAELKRLVFPTVLEDLKSLRTALDGGDGERCYLLLDRIHSVLKDLADQASRFYIFLAELARLSTLDPSTFLSHKERLITHLESFLWALQRHRPQLSAAVRSIEERGTEALFTLVAEADNHAFEAIPQRVQRWKQHWIGVRTWFLDDGGGTSKASQLDLRTTQAIRELAAILRRLSDAQYGGISRSSQLKDLAAWFVDCPNDDAASALYSITFGLGQPRHLSILSTDPSLAAPSIPASWWEGTPAPVSATLREHGKVGTTGRPPSLKPNLAAQRLAKERHKAQRDKKAKAEAGLLEHLGVAPLSPEELATLLSLLTLALQEGRPSAHNAPGKVIASHRRGQRQMSLRRSQEDTIIHSQNGHLVLKKMSLELRIPETKEQT